MLLLLMFEIPVATFIVNGSGTIKSPFCRLFAKLTKDRKIVKNTESTHIEQ